MLDKEGWMKFLNLFQSMDEILTLHLVLSWEDVKVEAEGISFLINQDLIIEVMGFALVGDKLLWGNHSIEIELQIFKEEKDDLDKFQGGINKDSLPLKWKDLFIMIMHYMILDNHSPIV